MSVAVLFLARGEDGGRAACEAFFQSWRDHPPGVSHELILVFKGWSCEADRRAVEAEGRGETIPRPARVLRLRHAHSILTRRELFSNNPRR